MPSISVLGVAFGYAGQNQLFERLELHLPSGCSALVGENGSGKSTLLALLAGARAPDVGMVRVQPPGALVILCPQLVEEITDDIRDLARRRDPDASVLRRRFRLVPAALERWSTLSEGERKRWQVAAALGRDPDVLLLDEPTNHLDESARADLRRALTEFRGCVLVVSHDRALLDTVAEHTLWLEDGRVRRYEGGYGVAEASRRVERATAERKRALANRAKSKSAQELDARRRKRARAQRNIKASGRIKGPRDSDGRSVNRRARAAKAEAALAREVRSLNTRHARNVGEVEGARVTKELGADLFVHFESPRRSRLAGLSLPSLGAGTKRLLGRFSCTVERDSRIRIVGDNGAGKSTLLRALVDALPEDTLYLPQELDQRARREAALALAALPKDERGRALRIVAALGCDPRRLLATSLPSPGEAKKLTIARGLGRGAGCVVLDEPTNHLDLPSIERLEAALIDYPGALVLVTHDAWFGERLTTTTLCIANGALSIR